VRGTRALWAHGGTTRVLGISLVALVAAGRLAGDSGLGRGKPGKQLPPGFTSDGGFAAGLAAGAEGTMKRRVAWRHARPGVLREPPDGTEVLRKTISLCPSRELLQNPGAVSSKPAGGRADHKGNSRVQRCLAFPARSLYKSSGQVPGAVLELNARFDRTRPEATQSKLAADHRPVASPLIARAPRRPQGGLGSRRSPHGLCGGTGDFVQNNPAGTCRISSSFLRQDLR
jgi:hypothetical protein